jgi:hypothetical protein
MPTGGRKPTSASLSELLEGLLEGKGRFYSGRRPCSRNPRSTDHNNGCGRCSQPVSREYRQTLAFLKSVDAVHRRLDDKLIEPKERDLSGKGHVLLATRIGPLDILAVIEGGRSYEELSEHTVEIDFRGHTLRVLDLKTLIELKKTSRDPKDKQRLPVLEETLRQLEEKYGRERDE